MRKMTSKYELGETFFKHDKKLSTRMTSSVELNLVDLELHSFDLFLQENYHKGKKFFRKIYN